MTSYETHLTFDFPKDQPFHDKFPYYQADFVYYPEQLTQNVAGTDFMTTNMIFGVNVSF